MTRFPKAASAVITVGDGRGFIVDHQGPVRQHRLVVTAAHCLPHFPPCLSISHTVEQTYAKLLAPLGGKPSVWAECLFVDPIGDIAVLGTPDRQEFYDESKAYYDLIEAESVTPMTVAPLARRGWLLSLDGVWFRCAIQHQKFGPLWLGDLEGKIVSGMSGSPVISTTGAAVGVVCVGGARPNPSLIGNLPCWFLADESVRR
jgi:hypothetical protein